MASSGESRTNRFVALQERNYRNYFLGTAISNSGNWAHRVAQDWLILNLTNSAQLLGVVVAAQFLPGFFFSLHAGKLADKVNPKRALIACNLVASGIAAILASLVLLDRVTSAHVIAAAFLLGVTNAIDGPIRQSYYVTLVGEDKLPSALSLNSANINIGRLFGPALAGVVIDTLGIGEAILFNSLSYLLCAFSLASIRPVDYRYQHVRKDGVPVLLRDGFAYVFREKRLFYSIFAVSFLAMWGQDMQFTSALMAKQVFEGSASGFGLMGSSIAAGAILGAVSFARHKTLPSIDLLTKRAFFMAGIWFCAALAPNYWLFLAALFGCGYFSMGVNISGNGGMRTYAAPDYYGRSWGIYIFAWQTMIAIGGIALGFLAELLSPRGAIAFGAVMALGMSTFLRLRFRTPE